MGLKELHDDIWLVSFVDYDLGYFDLKTRVLVRSATRSARGCYLCSIDVTEIGLPVLGHGAPIENWLNQTGRSAHFRFSEPAEAPLGMAAT